jgi:hypothetical protein
MNCKLPDERLSTNFFGVIEMTNPDSASEDSPRIIVDEDWKTQVERERETLRNQTESTADAIKSQPGGIERFPTPSLSGMIHMFASQAMAALGLLPDPMTGESAQNRPLAKFLIDTLAVLEQKTEGNRTDDESSELRDALHHLRMIFVAATTNQPNPANRMGPSKIELP